MEHIGFGPERLYIIGNGFDLHHNIECRYDQFRQWLQTNRKDVYNNLIRIYGSVCNSQWWETFEESLANFDPNKYPEEVARTPFFELQHNLVQRYGEEGRNVINCYEMENEDGVGNRYLLAEAIARFELIQLKNDLYEAFGEWVSGLTIPSDETPIKSIDTNALFFTFNYTRTLEDLYKISDKNILHLHGSVDKGIFVIGHNFTAREMNQRDLKEHIYDRDPENNMGEDEARLEMFQVIEDEMKKPVNDIIYENRVHFNALDTINEMIVLGFSYSSIDLPYLRRIFEITGKGISVKFGWHSQEDRNKAESFSKEMNLSNCKLIYF